MRSDIERTAHVVREWLGTLDARVAIVLGSGLGRLADALQHPKRLPYHDIPGFPPPGVAGHAGELIAGRLEGVPVLLQSGRFHLYEGHDPSTVGLPVRVFAALGVRALVVTNAAGGIHPQFRPPTLMLIADHINLMWRNPLLGPAAPGEQRFPDMSAPYDAALRALARDAAREAGIDLAEGTYAGVLGPSYETPAEIRMLRTMGAQAVGMSTVPEVFVARAQGLRVLGISCITNFGAAMTTARLSHQEVLAAGERTARDLEALLRAVLARTPL